MLTLSIARMRRKVLVAAGILPLCCLFAVAQSVQLNPTSSQTVAQPHGTSLNATILEQVRYADQFPGANPCIQIAYAITDLPSTGGTVDARAFEGSIPNCSSMNINKPVRLLLGAATYSWTGPYPLFTITSSGVTIEGAGRSPQMTWLNAPSGVTAFYVAAGAEDTAIRHLYIAAPVTNSNQRCNGSGSAGTGTWAIQIASNFPNGPNSVFFVEDVQIYGGFGGIQAINPINSSLKDVRVACTASDGFSFVGNGTTVTCINCYVSVAGGNGFSISGLANVTLVGGEAELSAGDGVYANSFNGNETVGLTITGLDLESNTGSGIHTDGACGTSVSGSSIINNRGDGLRISGGVGFVMTGGRLGGNSGYGLNAGVLSSLGYDSTDVAIFSPLTQYPSNGSGFLNDPYHEVLFYSGAALGIGGVTWHTGSGAPTGACASGSIYTNTMGSANSTLYVCQSRAWAPK
jgi:hypothetical protein